MLTDEEIKDIIITAIKESAGVGLSDLQIIYTVWFFDKRGLAKTAEEEEVAFKIRVMAIISTLQMQSVIYKMFGTYSLTNMPSLWDTYIYVHGKNDELLPST